MKPGMSRHTYVLHPVSASANLRRNCSERPLSSRKTPRVALDLKLDSIPLEVTDAQYHCLVTGGKTLHQVRAITFLS